MMKERQAADKELDKIARSEREKGEREIMMDLWGWLGNNTETYGDAFNAIEAYNTALHKTRRKFVDCRPEIMIKLSQSMAAQLLMDAECYAKMISKLEELQKNKPAL